MVVAEALASGLPVLGSTASQAVTELVEDNACGWHFDPLDSMSVTDALDRFFATSPATLEQMGKRGRAVARSVDVGSVTLRVVEAIDAVFDRDSSGSTVRTPRKTARGRVRD
jgi:glycosyltransferase involved in cell wall biosynthesis